MAKVGAAGATQYVAEGAPVPVDLPAAVQLVGPGSPAARARARTRAKDPAPAPAPAVERAPVTLSRARTGAAG